MECRAAAADPGSASRVSVGLGPRVAMPQDPGSVSLGLLALGPWEVTPSRYLLVSLLKQGVVATVVPLFASVLGRMHEILSVRQCRFGFDAY